MLGLGVYLRLLHNIGRGLGQIPERYALWRKAPRRHGGSGRGGGGRTFHHRQFFRGIGHLRGFQHRQTRAQTFEFRAGPACRRRGAWRRGSRLHGRDLFLQVVPFFFHALELGGGVGAAGVGFAVGRIQCFLQVVLVLFSGLELGGGVGSAGVNFAVGRVQILFAVARSLFNLSRSAVSCLRLSEAGPLAGGRDFKAVKSAVVLTDGLHFSQPGLKAGDVRGCQFVASSLDAAHAWSWVRLTSGA